jgi:5-methylcytosine-specific restriction endonuclease McrA
MNTATFRRHPGRSGAAWNRVRKQVLANSSVCWLCGKQIDPDAPPRSRLSASVDHVIPLSLMRNWDPEEQKRAALDPSNLRAAHFGCNSARRDRRPSHLRRRTSREW